MFIKKLIIGILSFYTVEIKRPLQEKSFDLFPSSSIELTYEAQKKREKEKRKERLYDKRKWKQRKKYTERTYKIKGTRPKDVRFSNQQKIRRMFRNG